MTMMRVRSAKTIVPVRFHSNLETSVARPTNPSKVAEVMSALSQSETTQTTQPRVLSHRVMAVVVFTGD